MLCDGLGNDPALPCASAIWERLVAGLDDNEDVLEELPHHLLDAVDDANVEAVEGELEDGTVTREDEGAEIVEAVPVAHLARHLVDAHWAFAIALFLATVQLFQTVGQCCQRLEKLHQQGPPSLRIP